MLRLVYVIQFFCNIFIADTYFAKRSKEQEYDEYMFILCSAVRRNVTGSLKLGCDGSIRVLFGQHENPNEPSQGIDSALTDTDVHAFYEGV